MTKASVAIVGSGKHQYRSVVQTAAFRVARTAMDDRNRSRE